MAATVDPSRVPEHPQPIGKREWSARIEHSGTSHYFPLGTNDEARAALQAAEISRRVARQGWQAVNQKFRRELTVAFRWADNPVAWTYATFHTHCPGAGTPETACPSKGMPTLQVAIVEPEAGIRHALAACVNGHEGFCCAASFASPSEAIREIPRLQPHLVMVNHSLASQTGTAFLAELRKPAAQTAGLIFSVYEDSDELFKSTPGGASGYLLKRTAPHRFLDPIASLVNGGSLFADQMALSVRQYFQRLVAAWSAGGPAAEMAKLTPREHDILGLLSKGYVDKEIADSLRISIWTVHGHVKNIFEKLGVHTRTEAVVKYLQK